MSAGSNAATWDAQHCGFSLIGQNGEPADANYPLTPCSQEKEHHLFVDTGCLSPLNCSVDNDEYSHKSTDTFLPFPESMYLWSDRFHASLNSLISPLEGDVKDDHAQTTNDLRLDDSDSVPQLLVNTPDSRVARHVYKESASAQAHFSNPSFETPSPALSNITEASNNNVKPIEPLVPILHVAARSRDDGIVATLLRHGMDVDIRDHIKKRTALHVASAEGNKAVAVLLLQYGADSNAKDKDGYSPLYLAVNAGHKDVVELLLGYCEKT
ncbi:hypothetical protein SGCOL_002990 [Colletotrichum sp. CLE4]